MNMKRLILAFVAMLLAGAACAVLLLRRRKTHA